MAENTKIEWCHATFNPWRGCQQVSPGCEHCYAETMSHRNPGTLGVWGPGGTRVVAAESYWRQPLKWDRQAERDGVRRRVFCASLADVFEDRPELVAPRRRLFALIDATPNLDWLLLTKRPENVLRMVPLFDAEEPVEWWPNVWLGVSVEDQRRADERIPVLLSIPAEVRFLSCEPLLGPVDLRLGAIGEVPATAAEPCNERADLLHWVIVGGESGPHARPMHPDWARSLRNQCTAAGVPFFFKQHGEWTAQSPMMPLPGGREVPRACVGVRWEPGMPDDEANEVIVYRVGKKAAGRTLDGREWNELPTIY